METINTWILPFTFIPGVGMLILSTANRYFQVKNRIREDLKDKSKEARAEVQRLLKRAGLFHRAITSQYLSIGCFALAALLGNIHNNWFPQYGTLCAALADFLILIGVLSIVFSAFQLIQESAMSLKNTRDAVKKAE